MTKAEIRAQISKTRPNFQTLEKMSAAVLEKFQTLEVFQQAKTIGAYMPLPDEVDVSSLLPLPSGSFLLDDTKNTFGIPQVQSLKTNCVGAQNFYIPAFDEKIDSYQMAKYAPELKKGKFGIPEPVRTEWAGADELDIILVPGVAFDRHGNRVGRGGGFYDRLLPLYDATRVAIGFDFQTLEKIPSEPHDCQVDFLVTESKILKFAMNS